MHQKSPKEITPNAAAIDTLLCFPILSFPTSLTKLIPEIPLPVVWPKVAGVAAVVCALDWKRYKHDLLQWTAAT